MLAAERKTCKEKQFAWSPKYSSAVENKNFWKTILMLKRNHAKPHQNIILWAGKMGIEDIGSMTITHINSHLRQAQKQLRAVQQEAVQLRENHLRELLEITRENEDDKQHERRLQILIRAHKQQYAYKKIQAILKPKQRAGLSHILVPDEGDPKAYPYDPDKVATWKMIYDHELLQNYLLKRNSSHFGQAHGTPFTIPPLTAIDWSATSEHAKEMLDNRKIHPDLNQKNPFVQEVLQYIATRQQLPDIDISITPEEVARGFRRWKETTSTSPSGCHLGLRRIPAIPTSDKNMEKIRLQILNVQTSIINIPLQQGFSPIRWQTVINAMLEKIPGKPLLHKLRVIHIMEADYNLTLKMIFGRRLMKNCEKHGTLGEIQDGFRKGRSTTRTLLHNELLNDYNKRLRIDNYVGMTDISGCFDRILPNIISLLNQRNGCPETAVKMHATTLQKAKYYIKTQSGISEQYYSNSMTPVYGNGQGAGDSPSQWSQESAMLFHIYEKLVSGAKMSLRNGTSLVEIPMAAFADDTNLMGNNDKGTKTASDLIEDVQQAFTTWDKLLHATGHFMELGKCACYLSIWKFQDDGYAYTMPPEEHQQMIYVTDPQGRKQQIPQLQTNKALKLLGVMKCPIGDQQDEVARLKSKSDNYARRINTNALTRSEAKLAYETFYIPALRYSLNITAINQTDMENIQAKATAAFLAAQGFNRHMPREVVYAPILYQGVGMRHLFDLQGADSTRLLLQEMNSEHTTTSRMITAVLDTIQMEAGIGKHILNDCRPLDYIEWGWIPQIRDFLHHINGRIVMENSRPKTYRENDTYLMDSEYLLKITQRERIYIHRCRIFLQVATISDITTADGQRIHEAWTSPSSEKPSKSTLNWPRQDSPNRTAWKAWEKFLRSFCQQQGKLRRPLGRWNGHKTPRIYKAYVSHDHSMLWTHSGRHYDGHPIKGARRRAMIYYRTSTTEVTSPPIDAIPTEEITQSKEEIRVTKPAACIPQRRQKTQITPWYKRSPPHLQHIIGDIEVMSDDLIKEKLTGTPNIQAASDGGHDPESGISTFGWTVAINKEIIARGRGPAQGHPDIAESF
jgi:hypothetical protein